MQTKKSLIAPIIVGGALAAVGATGSYLTSHDFYPDKKPFLLDKYVHDSCKLENSFFRDTPKFMLSEMIPGDSGWTMPDFESDIGPIFKCPGANVDTRITKTVNAYRIQRDLLDTMITPDEKGIVRYKLDG